MSFEAPSDSLTYERHFGLTEKAFSLASDSRFIYPSESFEAARKGLLAGIRRREGLLVLTGEIGTGKTTLCRTVLRDLGRQTHSSMVPDPFASREDLLKMLLVDFGAVSMADVTGPGFRQASRTELGYRLCEFLNSLGRDAFAVVVIDEAQHLSLPLIEEMRILFDTFGARGRLQIVFAGQPELHARLKTPEMRQVDQRVCGYQKLSPMSAAGVGSYVEHRLRTAGARPDRGLFPPTIIDVLHKRTGGVPRLINRVCDRALHLAHLQGAVTLNQEILDAALIEIGPTTLSPTWDSIIFSPAPTPAPAPPAPAASTVAAPAAVDEAPASDDFEREVDVWVKQDLRPPLRTLSPAPRVPAATNSTPPRAASSPAAATATRATPSRSARTDRPSHLRNERYMQSFWRTWLKRAAIAAVLIACVNGAMIGASLMLDAQQPLVLPKPVAPPARPVIYTLTSTPDPQAPIAAAGDAVAIGPISIPAVQENYLVSVGLFGGPERADQLVDALTDAGLPAMQREIAMRQSTVQQVVLGPYFSRDDAAADLERLRRLGGYDDARVIEQ